MLNKISLLLHLFPCSFPSLFTYHSPFPITLFLFPVHSQLLVFLGHLPNTLMSPSPLTRSLGMSTFTANHVLQPGVLMHQPRLSSAATARAPHRQLSTKHGTTVDAVLQVSAHSTVLRPSTPNHCWTFNKLWKVTDNVPHGIE